MDIQISGATLVVSGNIKTIHDYQLLKKKLDEVARDHKRIVLEIKDSISITSSVIGYLTKLVQKDGVEIAIKVGDANLYELFEEINLLSLFHVTKVL